MWAKTVKVICVVVLGLMLFDGFADAGGCDDSTSTTAACHVCACAAHVVPQGVIQVELVPARMDFIAYKSCLIPAPAPTKLLRPPCLAA